ncbi:clathrin adaptor, mu subunit [Patellaria atrata CBS 101060]|uniref:Clathrin adaptor, mu subunit n=1 Tax=Patellaria atrata CBS 101060 TaxID=1346257 RepID=A0A9P4SCN3_9PEZI|nr:clathrin adaptor, mu subunit [Patellaria atrata CBS 101060]
MGAIEALYIFDEHNNSILQHTYNGHPASAKVLLPLYLAQPAPRPSLTYLPNINPATLLFSIIQDRLLFLCPTSKDIEPLLVLEFLHRVADVLEDFLGSPLLASRIEASYDVVAQLLGEMCDASAIANTEPNALHDLVEPPSKINELLRGVGLPSSSPSLNPSGSTPFSLGSGPRPTIPRAPPPTPTVLWRKANVRHTSNELYVDIVETLSVLSAPSGRPLAAFAHGTIAFTAKVSGVPNLLLNLSVPGGIQHVLSLPVFHPCVRLARWREKPGELSFIPPDGRFVLAGYEVDLLGPDYLENATKAVSAKPHQKHNVAPNLNLPATAEVRTNLGHSGAEFEVRLLLSNSFTSSASSSLASSQSSAARSAPRPAFGIAAGTSAQPTVSDITVTVPLPPAVRNLSDIRANKGEAHFAPSDGAVEWRIASKDVAVLAASGHGAGGAAVATLRCTVVGPLNDDEEGIEEIAWGETWEYQDDKPYQAPGVKDVGGDKGRDTRRMGKNRMLMPSAARVSFQVKGWLASGIRVERLIVDTQTSRGLGAGVKPYTGAKYLTVSEGGVEVRC